MRIPQRFSSVLYGILQSGVTTSIATFIATRRQSGIGAEFAWEWFSAWGLSWAAMLPVVIGISPMLRRLVERLVRVD